MQKVIILLCTYQGQDFLEAQLKSIISQSYSNWKIVVSDDGSTDKTFDILNKYQDIIGESRFEVYTGPKKGFAANFISLISRIDICENNLYAYSDQDDIWKTDKLTRAVEFLQTIPSIKPALYCSRTELIDKDNQNIGYSPLFKKAPSFKNAIVQSIAGGNTMVFNRALYKILKEYSVNLNVVTHDWWTYLVVTGCGGEIFYDSYPSILYRQHSSNLVGSNINLFSKLKRIQMLFAGYFKRMNHSNIENLEKIFIKLTPENQRILNLFSIGRKEKGWKKILKIKQSGIYRQTLLGNFGLLVGLLFNKV